MSKRGENIYKRKDGRWEGRYIKARNEAGKIVYGYVYGRKYKVVKQRLAEMRIQYLSGYDNLKIYSGTVEQWLWYWLNGPMRSKIKVSTYFNYQLRIKKYIIPVIGDKKLIDLRTAHIKELSTHLEAAHMSGATIRAVFTVLKSALNQAVQDQLILNNPCQNIVIENRDREEVNALSKQEQQQIEQEALKEKNCSAAILALYTGMRIGEISGLKWSDVDFEKELIQVNKTIYRTSGSEGKGKTQVVIDEPKTKSSKRKIPLARNLKEYLLSQKAKALSEYVVSCKGSYAEPRVINYRFKQLLKKSEMTSIHFHMLRHTFATRCLENGVDIVTISKLLGHSSAKMTLDIYADSLWESRMEAISLVDKGLKKQSLKKMQTVEN